MVFSDLFFLFVFVPAFVICYLAAGWLDRHLSDKTGRHTAHALRNAALVVFSLLFYAWGEPVYVLLMLLCVWINYVSGRLMMRWERARKAMLAVGVACDIAILCSFKYLGFFAGILNDLGIEVEDPRISLPIGISFYVFQSISYLVDVYRGQSEPQRSYMGLLLYISMFPQLIAGPIVRYGTVAREIGERHVTGKDVADGVFRFLLGLGKKVIIANQLSEVSDRLLANGLDSLSTTGAWIGIAAFTLQIYFDFSGYSDMAIGIGRCLGFHFNENFDHPYCSRSITEFWRRWHMSLGSFFRDYVYIPLGGNRSHQLVNILIVWFLTGMWHGASWNFILWGLYFGIIVFVEKYTVLRISGRVPAPLLHLYTLAIVTVGWGIFYFDDFGQLVKFFTVAFGGSEAGLTDFVSLNILTSKFWLWIAAIAFCMPVRRSVQRLAVMTAGDGSMAVSHAELSMRLIVGAAILIASVALLVGATNNAFLYTRF